MSAQFIITLDDQIAELKGELALRERVFAKWIIDKRMSQEKADKRMAAMRGALHSLMELKGDLVPPMDGIQTDFMEVLRRSRSEEGMP